MWLVVINVVVYSREGSESKYGSVAGEKTS
jgi:hypothetical protein